MPWDPTALTVERVVYVSPTQAFGRLLTLAMNETDSAVTAWIAHDGNMGSDSDITVSGHALVGLDDVWIATGGDPYDLEVGHLLQDASGSSHAVVAVRYGNDVLAWIYPVTVAPGETVAIASFAMLATDQTSTAFVTTGFDGMGSDLLACMTDDEKVAVRNFDLGDTDEDGIAGIFDNCPDDANAGQADGDDNGVGTACDPEEDADTEVDAQADTGSDADSTDPVDEGSGCRCTSTPAPMSALWLVGALSLFGLRRRRS
ncbi:MAG: MYXO-CTERM domain-containing protein [Myxococcota bacterium]|jgi:MYXO-CTERM domain-containing protein